MDCPKCKKILNTDDIWCNSTVDSKNIIISIQCMECNYYAEITIDFSNFKEIKK